MKPSPSLLSLLPLTLAVDIRFHVGVPESQCNTQVTVSCSNINPNVCCFNAGHEISSASIAAVPAGWQLAAEGFMDPDCTMHMTEQDNYPAAGNLDFCLIGSVLVGQWSLRSAKYWFGTWKRDVAQEECTEHREVDTLTLADGTRYGIEGIGEDDLERLMAIAKNRTQAKDIPVQLLAFQIMDEA